jgi:Fur family ferric uptake transcriptional regulator
VDGIWTALVATSLHLASSINRSNDNLLVATESHLNYTSHTAGTLLRRSSDRERIRRITIATSCDSLGIIRMPLPRTEVPGRLQAQFQERGIRMTQQRRAILSVMETANKHLDASQILRKAQKIDASVDRSTVYRTLRLLKRNGMIDELDLMHINGEGHYYERRLERDHIHMACLRCGKISEFVSDEFEKLKQQVERDCRFRVLVSRLEIGGYCASCRAPQ